MNSDDAAPFSAQAAQARQLAERMSSDATRRELLKIADAYDRLAAVAERWEGKD